MRLINSFYLLAIVILTSCLGSSEKNSTQISDSTKTVVDTIKPESSVNLDSVYFYYDALVVEETNLLQDIDQNSPVIISLHTGDQLKIITQSDSAQKDPDDPESSSCEFGYFWYKVKTTDKKEGWVYGNRIIRKVKSSDQENSGNLKNLQELSGLEVKQGTTSYHFDAGITLPKDPVNAIPCDVICFPFFYDKSGKIYLIKANQDLFVSKDWLVQTRGELLTMVLNSEGGDVVIKKIAKDPAGPQFECEHSYQDGGASSTIYLKFSTDHFTVERYEFKKDSY